MVSSSRNKFSFSFHNSLFFVKVLTDAANQIMVLLDYQTALRTTMKIARMHGAAV